MAGDGQVPVSKQCVARRVACAAAGLALGAVLGHATGLEIRSDNLPFFDILGALAGIVGGCTAFSVWRRVSTDR